MERNHMNQSKSHTLYVNALNELAMIHLERAEDSTFYFSQKALKVAQRMVYAERILFLPAEK